MEYGDLLALLVLDRDTVLFGIGHQRLARGQIPFAPRCDDPDIGIERVGAEFEAHLVVTLAGRAMRDGVGAGLVGDLHQTLGDQRARDGGTEQVLALVHGVGAEHREHEIAREFLAQCLDVDLLDAHGLGLGARRLDLLALADVGGEGHHLAAVGLLQPLEDDGGIQTARVGEHHFFYVRHSTCNPVNALSLSGGGWGEGNRIQDAGLFKLPHPPPAPGRPGLLPAEPEERASRRRNSLKLTVRRAHPTDSPSPGIPEARV